MTLSKSYDNNLFGTKIVKTLVLIVLSIATLLGVCYFVFGFRTVTVFGNAMLPHYKSGQKYIKRAINKSDNLKRGDVVIVNQPDNLKNVSLKRIIGLPNEKLLLQEGRVYINGVVLDESEYLPTSTATHEFLGMGIVKEGEEVSIPADSYFVMGDNRSKSADSRVYGSIPRESVLGTLFICYAGCR